MNVLTILKYGEPILRMKALELNSIEKEDILLLEEMTETMYAYNGIGLAAPQVGISKRIIVIDIGDGLKKLINPIVLHEEGEDKEKEGCLSIPNVYIKVRRPLHMVVEGLDEKRNKIRIEAEGLMARALHHEIDHLNGFLIVDYASLLERIVLKKELKKIRRY